MINLYGIAQEADADEEYSTWRLFKLIRHDSGELVWKQIPLVEMKPLTNGRPLTTRDTENLNVVLDHYRIGYDAYLGEFPHHDWYFEIPYKEEHLRVKNP